MKPLTAFLLSLISIFPCCADKNIPKLPLTTIRYTYGSQMIAYPEYSVTFMTREDSVLAIVFNIDEIQYSLYRITQPDVMKKMKDIIIKEKMYKYKDSYSNPHVLDGDGWTFYAGFKDDVDDRHQHYESISSGGSNKWPKGDGLKLIRQAMNEALSSAEFLRLCDENGNEITKDPNEEVTENTEAENENQDEQD